MMDEDDAILVFAAAILRGSDREIEALSLEAMASDAGPGGLDQALTQASRSEIRGGAFGMEIAGAIIVPLLVDVVRQVWNAYSGELVKTIGKSGADLTVAHLKHWFQRAPTQEKLPFSEQLASAIRSAGAERGLSAADIDALVQATAPEKLSVTL